MAYDLAKIRSTRETKDNKSDDVPDSFFDLTADDLRSVLNGLQHQK
jgi:hypothetical protein